MVDNFIAEKRFPFHEKGLLPNSYVVLRDQHDPNHTVAGRFSADEQEIIPLKIPEQGVWGVKPRNVEQACVLDALLDDSINLVSLVGKAGTGKTLLALACGLQKTIDEGKYQKLLVSRPIFSIGKRYWLSSRRARRKAQPLDATYF